jgi:hypothetical protein
MGMTAQQLIEKAYFLSGIISRNLQVPTGDQIEQGLYILNALLDFKQIETDLIPYWQYIELPCTPNQADYFLPYVAAVESATFNLSVVRYPMKSNSRTSFYGSARVDNVSALPFSYNFNRGVGGGTLSIYFLPLSDYPLKMMVKLFLVNVTLDTDLTDISRLVPYRFLDNSNQGFDTSYVEYLRYALADKLCEEYGVQLNPQAAQTLLSYERKLMYQSPPDLTMQKSCALNASGTPTLNWAFVNLANGWVPS